MVSDALHLHRRRERALLDHVRARWAGADLMTLADDLRRMSAPKPRGVAMAERLITDPGSPLYRATSGDEIQRAVRAATWNLYR